MKINVQQQTGLNRLLFFCFLCFSVNYSCALGEERVDATARYDKNNVFAQILRGDLPADIVFESDYALAFHDIRPTARVHVLIIPKGQFTNVNHFNATASDREKLGLLDAISQTSRIMGVDESGFRLVSNTGLHGGQTIAHFHIHLLGGEQLPQL